MTDKDIDKLSLKEAKEKLKSIFRHKSVVNTLLIIEEKMLSIGNQFGDGDIDVFSDKDDAAFDRFLKFSKDSITIERAQTERLTIIDEDELLKERKKRTGAKPGSVEYFAMQNQDGVQ